MDGSVWGLCDSVHLSEVGEHFVVLCCTESMCNCVGGFLGMVFLTLLQYIIHLYNTGDYSRQKGEIGNGNCM